MCQYPRPFVPKLNRWQGRLRGAYGTKVDPLGTHSRRAAKVSSNVRPWDNTKKGVPRVGTPIDQAKSLDYSI